MDWHYQITFNALAAFIAAGVNLYYILRHVNGKKPVRAMSFGVLLYFAVIQTLVVLEFTPYKDYGMIYFRPWMPVLFCLPVFDVIVDFKHLYERMQEGSNKNDKHN